MPRVDKPYPPELFRPHAERFWAKVDHENGPTMPNMETPCWPWTGTAPGGRGQFSVQHHGYLSYRIAYALHHDTDPGAGMQVCHTCDNPLCCRPDHLFVGTPKDNSQDRVAKGRGRIRIGPPKPPRKPQKFKPIDIAIVELYADRFHEKHHTGTMGECWEWYRGHRRPNFAIPLPDRQDWYPAERIAWALHNNRDPGPLFVRHTCDNPRCVNPHHLILGTPKQNSADMLERAGPARAKLLEDEVRVLRAEYAAGGVTQPQLAAKYGISSRQVWHILARKSWAHIA